MREIGDVSYVHFDYINPLPANTEEVFSHFEEILVCELNSGQFADYLRAQFPGRRIEKFNKVGMPALFVMLVIIIIKSLAFFLFFIIQPLPYHIVNLFP